MRAARQRVSGRFAATYRTMSRAADERYACEKCGAELIYTKACPCNDARSHSEICCGEQMRRVETREGED